MIVFLTSAFWHGFYPMYYIMFFLAAVLSECTKDVYKCWIYFQAIPKPVRYICAHLLTMGCMNWFGILIAALTFENGFRFMNNVFWIVPIGLFTVLGLFRGLGLVGKATKAVNKMKEAETKKE